MQTIMRGLGRRERNSKGALGNGCGMIDVFIILIVVMVCPLMSKLFKFYSFNVCHPSYVIIHQESCKKMIQNIRNVFFNTEDSLSSI